MTADPEKDVLSHRSHLHASLAITALVELCYSKVLLDISAATAHLAGVRLSTLLDFWITTTLHPYRRLLKKLEDGTSLHQPCSKRKLVGEQNLPLTA